jgi:NAD(P)-dependent dehydrogenase (short-subunit alcohol dehydrogenase family)
MDLMLNGKTAIVTGSTGICKEIALTLAKEGCDIAITYLTDKDRDAAQDSIAKINSMGRKAISTFCDVRNMKDIEKMVGRVLKEYGKIDILVNCAGICTSVLAENVTEEQWDLDTGVDLKGLFFCCKEVFNRAMKGQKSGSIVNIASVLGVDPIKTNPIYSVAKAGVIHLSRYLAIEWGPYGVRVNAVSPGWTATEMLIEFQKSGKSADPNSVTRSVPLGRFGKPSEMADLVAFVASARSSYTTGSNFVADGGIIAGIRLASLINGKIDML